MLLTRLRHFFAISKTTQRHIKVGFLTICAALILHSSASFQLLLGFVIFTVFSLYLYQERLQARVIQLEADKARNESLDVHLNSPKKKLSEAKKEPFEKLDKSIEMTMAEKDPDIVILSKNVSDLLSKFEKMDDLASINNDSIKNLQNSIAVLSRRMEKFEKITNTLQNSQAGILKSGPSHTEIAAIQELKVKVAQLYNKQNLQSNLEKKVGELQNSLKSLKESQNKDEETEKFKLAMRKSMARINKMDEKLNTISQQGPDVAKLELKVSEVEKKTKLLNDVLQLLENTHLRLTRDEAGIKVLSNSVLTLGESVNLRIDGLSELMKQYFLDITRAMEKTQKA